MLWFLEVMIGFAVLVVSNIFWSTLRADSFRQKLIRNAAEIKRMVELIGRDHLTSEGDAVQPAFGSYSNNIALFLHAGIKGLDRTRNIVGFITIGLLTLSFFVNPLFAAINLGLFFIVSFMDIHSYVKNSVATDLHSVMLNIYKWDKEDHASCKLFCTVEKPYLAVLHEVVTSSK